MTITIEIPDELAAALAPPGQDLRRTALEAIALDGYRSDRLTEADVRQTTFWAITSPKLLPPR
jgi:hypothetical protein